MIDPETLLAMAPIEKRQSYTWQDTVLYALGIGIGLEERAKNDLRYLLEDRLETFPTMAAVLGHPGFWMRDARYGMNWAHVLHGEQDLTLHRTIPPAGEVVGLTRVIGVEDRGPNRGAAMNVVRAIHDARTGDLLATSGSLILLRRDGGFGGTYGTMPQREPEVAEAGPEQSIDMPTVHGQALLYRLSGDHNPLHSDPAIAAEAGFPRPILHGLCSFGMAGRAAVRLLCSGDGSRLRRLIVRFSAPAWPGERMLFTLKRSRAGQAHLRAQSAGRDILTRGVIEFQPGQTVSFGQDSPISEE